MAFSKIHTAPSRWTSKTKARKARLLSEDA
jgi:hypothetical protein